MKYEEKFLRVSTLIEILSTCDMNAFITIEDCYCCSENQLTTGVSVVSGDIVILRAWDSDFEDVDDEDEDE